METLEIGPCAIVWGTLAMAFLAILFAIFAGPWLHDQWTKTGGGPPSGDSGSYLSRAMRTMMHEAERLGVTFRRAAMVTVPVAVIILAVMYMPSITVSEECGKGDIAMTPMTKKVMATAGIPCPCGCDKHK